MPVSRFYLSEAICASGLTEKYRDANLTFLDKTMHIADAHLTHRACLPKATLRGIELSSLHS